MKLSVLCKIAGLLIVVTALSGCGTFHHLQQTYYVAQSTGDSPPENTKTTPRLFIQVVPSTESSVIPFFYHSRKWGAPYFIQFSANTRDTYCTYFLVHSIKLTSKNTLLVDETYSTPLKLDVCEKEYRNKHKLFAYSIGESLQFEEGREIELQVTYEQPDVGVKSVTLTGSGEQKSSKTPLVSAYMGI